jgi:hypothetical protein
MRLVLIDGAIGVLLLAAIVAAAARGWTRRPAWARTCGWLLVVVPLPLAVVLQLDQVAFLAGVAAFAVGAALILGDDEQDWGREAEADTPPWWPAFERELREYELQQRQRPKALR